MFESKWNSYQYIYDKKTKKISKIVDKSNLKTIVKINKKYLRPNEVPFLKGDYSKAKKLLKWQPKIKLETLIKEMLSSEKLHKDVIEKNNNNIYF